jgi:hypothetical protein
MENGNTENGDHAASEGTAARQHESAGDAFAGGYKHPPVNTRFKKGKSGNLKGRPKGSRKLPSLFDEILKETVRTRDGDKVRRISVADALVRLALNGVIKGEPGAINALTFLLEKTGRLDPSEESDGRRYGYLIVGKKMSPEEWDKAALKALEHVQEPDPRFKQQTRLPKLTVDPLTGKATIHPLD